MTTPDLPDMRGTSSCPGNSRSGANVDLYRYHELHREGQRLIEGWFSRAVHASWRCRPEDSFEPFIFGWIGFNGWAACCSGMDRDESWRDALASCPQLVTGFQAMMAADPEFAASVRRFKAMWPIFKAQQLQAGGINTDGRNRDELVRQYLAQGLRRAPVCFQHHINRRPPEEVPADWPHTLMALYQVRCNLFHGQKSAHSEMDSEIVYSALQVLVQFLLPYIGRERRV